MRWLTPARHSRAYWASPLMHQDWQRLATGVYRCRLEFLDVTVGLITGQAGALLIDCGTTLEEADDVAADVEELTGRTVEHLVLTHHHFDHIYGMGRFPDARVYTTAAVSDALRTGAFRDEAIGYGAHPDQIDEAIGALREPDEILACRPGGVTIDLGGRHVTVEHPGPGHTDHDLVVLAPPLEPGEPPVVFCGDLIEQSADPAIDDESDLESWPATLDRLLELGGPDAIYVPGHGALVDAGFVLQQRRWLAERPSR